LKKLLQDAGLERLVSFPVVHCPQAFGVTLRAAQRTNGINGVIPGWKVVYSGDTRPCPELIEASRGATVLIHEVSGITKDFVLLIYAQQIKVDNVLFLSLLAQLLNCILGLKCFFVHGLGKKKSHCWQFLAFGL